MVKRERHPQVATMLFGIVLASIWLGSTPCTAAAPILPVPQCADGGPAPDDRFQSAGLITYPLDAGALDAIIDYIDENLDPVTADNLRDDLTGADTCVNVRKIFQPEGKADATTIGIRVKNTPMWRQALILIHEYTHWQSARAAAVVSGNPHQTDPDTDPDSGGGNPCAWCNHAQIGAQDLVNLGILCGDASPAVIVEICTFYKSAARQIGKALTKCKYQGCPTVPSSGSILTSPPCCQ